MSGEEEFTPRRTCVSNDNWELTRYAQQGPSGEKGSGFMGTSAAEV